MEPTFEALDKYLACGAHVVISRESGVVTTATAIHGKAKVREGHGNTVLAALLVLSEKLALASDAPPNVAA